MPASAEHTYVIRINQGLSAGETSDVLDIHEKISLRAVSVDAVRRRLQRSGGAFIAGFRALSGHYVRVQLKMHRSVKEELPFHTGFVHKAALFAQFPPISVQSSLTKPRIRLGVSHDRTSCIAKL